MRYVVLYLFYVNLYYIWIDVCVCVFVCREGRVSGIMEVSRSFGDGRFKHCGVVCTPDVIKCTLTPQDRWGTSDKPRQIITTSSLMQKLFDYAT